MAAQCLFMSMAAIHVQCLFVSMAAIHVQRLFMSMAVNNNMTICVPNFSVCTISMHQHVCINFVLAHSLSLQTPTLQHYSGYTVESILPVVERLNSMLKAPLTQQLTVRSKYSHE